MKNIVSRLNDAYLTGLFDRSLAKEAAEKIDRLYVLLMEIETAPDLFLGYHLSQRISEELEND